MKTTNNEGKPTWLKALAEAARQQQFELPAFAATGMGALRSETTLGNRFATLKRLFRGGKSDFDGVEWALWQQVEDHPLLVAAFRDALEPQDEPVRLTLMILKGWLVDQWSADDAKQAVNEHPRGQRVEAPAIGVPVTQGNH